MGEDANVHHFGSDRSDRRWTKRLRNIPIAVTMLGSLLCLGPAPAAESQPDKGPTLPVPVTDSTPVIDGKLDEPCWKNAARTGPLKDTHGEPGKPATEAFILRDADHLYVGSALRRKGGRGRRCQGRRAREAEWNSPSCSSTPMAIGIPTTGSGSARKTAARSLVPTTNMRRPGATGRGNRSSSRPWPRARMAWTAEFALPLDIFSKNKTLASEIGFNVRRSGAAGTGNPGLAGHVRQSRRLGNPDGHPGAASLPEPDYAKPKPDPSSSGAQWGVTVYLPPTPREERFWPNSASRRWSLAPVRLIRARRAR